TIGLSKGGRTTPCLNQKRIAMPVIAAGKFDDFVFFGVSPGEPDSAHTSLRPAVHKTDLVDIRYHGTRQLRNLGFDFCRSAKRSPFFCFFDNRIDNRRMGMT